MPTSPLRYRRRFRAVAAAAVVGSMVAGCTVNAAPTPPSLVPLVPPDQLPITTVAATTTTAPSSRPDDPLLTSLPDGECLWADALPGGEITFVAGDRLIGASPDASVVRCLTTLTAAQRGVVRWSPIANRAMLNSATVFDVAGIRASGFDPATTRLVWEYPVGDGLIAPTPSGRTLVRRSAVDGARTEITFLARTVVVASHPSGQGLLAAGNTGDGMNGVFLAAPDGTAARPLLFSGDDRVFDELAVDPSGWSAYIISERGDSFFLHRFSLADYSAAEVASGPTPLLRAVPGPTATSVAWQEGLCNSVTDTWVFDDRTASRRVVGAGTPLEDLSLAPVGWLDANRLVVAARPLGCDGAAAVWIWNLVDGSATLLATSVEQPALRLLQPQATLPAVDPAVQPALL